MRDNTTYVAIDAHKKEHRVAMQLPEESGPFTWTMANEKRAIRRMAKRVRKEAPGEVVVCYEAGPCGFALQRQLEQEGLPCIVVAPSLIPTEPGRRVKTDRRDAAKLVDLLRAGLLTAVHPPTEEEEAARDMCRCRDTAREDLMRARHRLLKFLSRQALIFRDGKHWTRKHREWLRSLRFENRKLERVFTEYLSQVEHEEERLKALERELENLAQEEPYREPVAWLKCFRGFDTVTATSLVVELYAFGRFPSPRGLMAYVGMTPSEESSGEVRRQGGITKAGNRRVRRLLVEASWHQRHRPVVGKTLRKRREGQPRWVIEIADRAQKRLHRRYQHLTDRGKPKKVAVTAVAREMVGFVWAVLYSRESGALSSNQA